MPEDRIIKTGQLTWPRILFLLVCGVIFFVIVTTGKLAFGYLLVTAALCLILLFVMIDYRVEMGKVETKESPSQPVAEIFSPVANSSATAPVRETRPRRRSSRPAKRRR